MKRQQAINEIPLLRQLRHQYIPHSCLQSCEYRLHHSITQKREKGTGKKRRIEIQRDPHQEQIYQTTTFTQAYIPILLLYSNPPQTSHPTCKLSQEKINTLKLRAQYIHAHHPQVGNNITFISRSESEYDI